MALGRVVPARRAIAATSAREGKKARNVALWNVVWVKSLENLILDVFLVVDHDSDLKNRCSTGRFRAIAIHILSLYGDSMILAVCIFSQSATGEVSCAYFRKLAISRGGECKFSQTGPNARLCPYSNTLTVRTCGPQAIDRT